ncbi:MAG: hypothetical protein HDR01_07095 [Lachnospiraceae bacterium]|nr:hypothetical protein [Lachnospiraceae bacterium]
MENVEPAALLQKEYKKQKWYWKSLVCHAMIVSDSRLLRCPVSSGDGSAPAILAKKE